MVITQAQALALIAAARPILKAAAARPTGEMNGQPVYNLQLKQNIHIVDQIQVTTADGDALVTAAAGIP